MLTSTTELKRLDIFTHLNGSNYMVDSVEWIGGDNYAVTCIDNNDDLVTFTVDVHTKFNVTLTYTKGNKINTIIMITNNGQQLVETCTDAELKDAVDGAAHFYFKSRIKTFTVNGVPFDESKYEVVN